MERWLFSRYPEYLPGRSLSEELKNYSLELFRVYEQGRRFAEGEAEMNVYSQAVGYEYRRRPWRAMQGIDNSKMSILSVHASSTRVEVESFFKKFIEWRPLTSSCLLAEQPVSKTQPLLTTPLSNVRFPVYSTSRPRKSRLSVKKRVFLLEILIFHSSLIVVKPNYCSFVCSSPSGKSYSFKIYQNLKLARFFLFRRRSWSI